MDLARSFHTHRPQGEHMNRFSGLYASHHRGASDHDDGERNHE